MDILYIVGKQSFSNHSELRFSLRSIEKYGKNVDRVFVSGYVPEFCSDNVVKIPFTQTHGSLKAANRLENIEYIVNNTDISEEFLLSSDDHFYCQEVDFDNYPYYHSGLISNMNGDGDVVLVKDKTNDTMRKAKSAYRICMNETREFLEKWNLPIKRYGIHKNSHVFKSIVKSMPKEMLEEAKTTGILGIEPICLINNFEMSVRPFEDKYDCDSWHVRNLDELLEKVEKTDCFTTLDFVESSVMHKVLSILYDEKSKYEK